MTNLSPHGDRHATSFNEARRGEWSMSRQQRCKANGVPRRSFGARLLSGLHYPLNATTAVAKYSKKNKVIDKHSRGE